MNLKIKHGDIVMLFVILGSVFHIIKTDGAVRKFETAAMCYPPLTVWLCGGGCDVSAAKQQYWARRVQALGSGPERV